jgi:type III restriction enzyme
VVLIEIKARNELGTDEVKEKAQAAIRWCQIAADKQGGKPWSYAVIPDEAVSSTSTLDHMLALAVRQLSSQ